MGCYGYRDRMSAKIIQVTVFTEQENLRRWGIEFAITQIEVGSKVIGTCRQDVYDAINIKLLAPWSSKVCLHALLCNYNVTLFCILVALTCTAVQLRF